MSVDIPGAERAQCKDESSFISSFHQALTAPVISTDVSQVGVALFLSF